MNERLSTIEYDIKDIKGNVAKLEEGLNSVNSDVAEIKQDLEKKAEKEKLEELENEVEELRNRSRRNNLVFYNVPEKSRWTRICRIHSRLDSHPHGPRDPIKCSPYTNKASENSGKKKPRPIHVALLRYTDKVKILSNAAARIKDNPFQGNLIGIGADFAKRTQERRKEL
ncbi:unnamed protein product, partial [Porites evermanni]